MAKKKVQTLLHTTSIKEKQYSVTHPLYIKHIYAEERDYLNMSITKVADDDSYLELSVEKSNNDVSYSIDTGTYNYSGNDINRILGRAEYSSTEDEFNKLLTEIQTYLEGNKWNQ